MSAERYALPDEWANVMRMLSDAQARAEAAEAKVAELQARLDTLGPNPLPPGQIESLCHWVHEYHARGGDVTDSKMPETHTEFHFGNVCPYWAVAAIIRGQNDPRGEWRPVAPDEGSAEHGARGDGDR